MHENIGPKWRFWGIALSQTAYILWGFQTVLTKERKAAKVTRLLNCLIATYFGGRLVMPVAGPSFCSMPYHKIWKGKFLILRCFFFCFCWGQTEARKTVKLSLAKEMFLYLKRHFCLCFLRNFPLFLFSFWKVRKACPISCFLFVGLVVIYRVLRPSAEYALVVNYQFWLPTSPCWLTASWERN